MHIQSVNYQQTFNTGNYSSQKIGIEIAVNQGESASKALNTAKELVNEFFKESMANMPEVGFEEPAEIIQTQSPKTLNDRTKEFINTCNSIEELKAWELMSKRNDELKKSYEDKMAKLVTAKIK